MRLMRADWSWSRIDINHSRHGRIFALLHSKRHVQLITPDDIYLDGPITSLPTAYT